MSSDRVTLYRTFAERFRAGGAGDVKAVPIADVERAEADLGAKLPASYKVFATQVGAGSFRLLGDAWSNGADSDCQVPLEHVWHPAVIVRQCGQPWLAPIPAEVSGGTALASDVAWKYLLPFGQDDNRDYWHCFPRQSCDADDLPVYVFDHDGGAIERVSSGFDELIDRFLRLRDTP